MTNEQPHKTIDIIFVTDLMSKFLSMNKEVTMAINDATQRLQAISTRLSTPPLNQDIVNILSDLQRKLQETLKQELKDDQLLILKESGLEHGKSASGIVSEIKQVNTSITELKKSIDDFRVRVAWLFGILMLAWGIVAGFLIFIKGP
jgi:hypothetical protein